MRCAVAIAVLGFVVACTRGSASTTTSRRTTTGSIAGIARDHDSGDPVAHAEIRVRAQGQFEPKRTTTLKEGLYSVDDLAPGRYQLSALFAGQPIDVTNIEVRVGEVATVDLMFTLGRPDPIRLDWGDPKASEIDRYHPRAISPQVARLEGVVRDLGTKGSVAGAVVTASSDRDALQTVTDDQGRYRIDATPGTYAISAYYSVASRAQIEVRRSDIAVAGGEAVIVPLWIEVGR